MKISQLSFEKIENYDPFNKHAKDNGMVTEWAARNKRVLRQLLGIQKRNAWQMREGIEN